MSASPSTSTAGATGPRSCSCTATRTTARCGSGVAAELAAKHRVVTYDVRGAGQSDKPPGRASYRLDQLADDLRAVVDEVQPDRQGAPGRPRLGLDPDLARRHRGGLRGRIASYTSISGPSLDHAGAWFRAQLTPPDAEAAQERAEPVPALVVHPRVPGPVRPGPAVAHRLCWASRSSGWSRTRRPRRSPTACTVCELYRANMFTRLSRPAPRAVDVPVQVLAPTGDAYVTTPLQTEVTRWVPDLRIRRIVGTHWVTRAKPAVVAARGRRADRVRRNRHREPRAAQGTRRRRAGSRTSSSSSPAPAAGSAAPPRSPSPARAPTSSSPTSTRRAPRKP